MRCLQCCLKGGEPGKFVQLGLVRGVLNLLLDGAYCASMRKYLKAIVGIP